VAIIVKRTIQKIGVASMAVSRSSDFYAKSNKLSSEMNPLPADIVDFTNHTEEALRPSEVKVSFEGYWR